MQAPCGDEVPNSSSLASYPQSSSRIINATHNSGRTMNLAASVGQRVITMSIMIECSAHDDFGVSDEELYRALLVALAVRSGSLSPR